MNNISFNKKKYKHPLFFNFVLFIFIINLKDSKAYQEINITINGNGRQQIVNSGYSSYYKPNVILINGILQNYVDFYVDNLTQKINIITMRWFIKLKSCINMFSGLKNIMDFDFSNFDTSQVTEMGGMFQNLELLKTLDLSNFNTAIVKDMHQMFNGCTSLVSLNLNNFKTSQVRDFSWMFYNCNSLIYLNLYSFIIQDNVEIDSSMIPKKSVNLFLCFNIQTASKLMSNLNGHLNNCNNNCFINEAKLIIDKRTCIDRCANDNLYKYEYKNICFKTNSCSEISEYLYGNSDNEIYCNNQTKLIDEISEGYYLNDTNNKTIDKCNPKCKSCNNESNINDLCLLCNIENNYYPIINNTSNINSYINCSNYTPSGYIFDNYSLSYKPCYSTCKECKELGDNYNHQCLSCNENYYLNDTNCFENCTYYYYFDNLHIYHCTEDDKCPSDKSKLIKEKGECIEDCSKDNLYKYEYNNLCYNYNILPESTILIINNNFQKSI